MKSNEELLELDAGGLKGDETLEGFESWDSLAVISFIALADEHFDIMVEGEALANATSVADLLRLVGLEEKATVA